MLLFFLFLFSSLGALTPACVKTLNTAKPEGGNPEALRGWLNDAAARGCLDRYLESKNPRQELLFEIVDYKASTVRHKKGCRIKYKLDQLEGGSPLPEITNAVLKRCPRRSTFDTVPLDAFDGTFTALTTQEAAKSWFTRLMESLNEKNKKAPSLSSTVKSKSRCLCPEKEMTIGQEMSALGGVRVMIKEKVSLPQYFLFLLKVVFFLISSLVSKSTPVPLERRHWFTLSSNLSPCTKATYNPRKNLISSHLESHTFPQKTAMRKMTSCAKRSK